MNNILNSILLSTLVAAGIGGVAVYNVNKINTDTEQQSVLSDKENNLQNKDQVNSSGNELESELTAKPTPSTKSTYKTTYRGENEDEDEYESEDEDEGGYTPKNSAPATNPTPTPTATYTLADVKLHATRTNCWTTVNGKVYDVTSFISQHPGGSNAIIGLCGIDGSAAFNGQHGSQARPANELASFIIGILK